MRTKIDVPFKCGMVRIESNLDRFSVAILDDDRQNEKEANTDELDDLRQLAKALNLTADLIEGNC